MRSSPSPLIYMVFAAVLSCSDPVTVSQRVNAADSPRNGEPAMIGKSAVPPALAAEYVQTPAGEYHRSCVHLLPDSAIASEQGIAMIDGSRRSVEPCHYPVYPRRRPVASTAPAPISTPGLAAQLMPPTVSGWVEYVFTSADDSVCTGGSCGSGAYADVFAWVIGANSPYYTSVTLAHY